MEEFLDKIICGDCTEVIKKIPDNSVDLVVTSPPYNLQKAGAGDFWKNSKVLINGYDNYNDSMNDNEYAEWQHNLLLEFLRVIKNDGAIFYNHKFNIRNKMLMDRRDIVYDVPLRQIIIWKRGGGINFSDCFFLPTYEVIFLIAKNKFKLKKHCNVLGDVWNINQELKNNHPAPFPVELVDRIISSTNAQIILDPFMGSGTTAVVAKELGRHYIGIEQSEKYCQMCEERLKKSDSFPETARFHRQTFFKLSKETMSRKLGKHNNIFDIK